MKVPMNLRNGKTEAALFLLVTAFLLTAVNPSFYMDDSPEIITASALLGPAHPPGYPLYLLLGRLFVLTAPGAVPWRVNLLSALLASLGVVLLFRLLTVAFRLGRAEALLFSLFWITGATAFQGALSAKAGMYHLASLLWLAQALALLTGRLPLAAFFLGLSLAHHWMTAVPAALGLWFFIRRVSPSRPLAFSSRVRAATWTVLGVFLYLVLPLRAALDPVLNYGDPSRWSSFYDHLTLKQFWSPRGHYDTALWLRQWSAWVLLLFKEYPWIAPLGLWGLIDRIRTRRSSGVSWLAAWLLSVSAVNFFLRAEETWFDLYLRVQLFPTHLFLFPFAAWGWRRFFHSSGGPSREKLRHAVLAASLAVLVLLAFWRTTNLRQTWYTYNYDYAVNAFRCVPRGGLLYTKGDILDFPCWYLQKIEGRRPDIVAVSINNLPKEWFRRELARAGLSVPAPDPERLQGDARRYIRLLSEDNRDRPLFTTYDDLKQDRLEDAATLPWGVLQRVFLPPDMPGPAEGSVGIWKGLRLRHVLHPPGPLDPATRKYLLGDYATTRNNLGLLFFRRARNQALTALDLSQRLKVKGETAVWMGTALDQFQAAHLVDPASDRYARNAGLACLFLQRPQEAWDWLMIADRLAPDSIETLYSLAIVALQMRRFAEAGGFYDRILLVDPKNAPAREGRQWLVENKLYPVK